MSDDLVTDRAGVARIFAVTLNHVNKLRSRGMPRLAHGQYSIPAVVQWRMEQLSNKAALDADEMPAAVEARTKLITAQEIHKRLEIRKMENELLPVEQVRTLFMTATQILITGLEGLPTRAAQDLATCSTVSDCVAKLQEHCHDVRIQLANRLDAMANDVDDLIAADDAAAEEDSGAVGEC